MQLPGAIAFALDGALIGAHDERFLGRVAVINLIAYLPLAVLDAVRARTGHRRSVERPAELDGDARRDEPWPLAIAEVVVATPRSAPGSADTGRSLIRCTRAAGSTPAAPASGGRRRATARSPPPGGAPRSVAAGLASTSSTRSGSSVVHVSTGTLGSQRPSGSCTASIARVWLATRIFGTSRRCGPALHRRRQPIDVHPRRVPRALGEAHRTRPPVAFARVDQPAGDQRRTVAFVAHGIDQPVVDVAEVDGERGDRAEIAAAVDGAGGASPSAIIHDHDGDSAATGRRPCGSTVVRPHDRCAGANDGPKLRATVSSATPPTSHTPAHVATAASNTGASDHQHHRSAARSSTPARIAAASRAASSGCGSTRPTRPTGADDADGQREELGGGVGVRAAAPRRRTAARRRDGQLVEERRVADDDVERRRPPSPRPARRRSGCRAPRQAADATAPGRCPRRRAAPARPSRASATPTPRRGTARRRTPGRAPAPVGRRTPRRPPPDPSAPTTASTNAGGVYQAPRRLRCDAGTGRA